MEDYIKRSDALNFEMKIECEPDDLQPMMEGMVRVMDYIKKLPAADVVEVVHAGWDDYGAGVCCTACGISLFHQDENNNAGIEPSHFCFCPYCGARMDGGDHDAAD